VKSIRTFLVSALLALITLVNFIAIVNGYSKSMRQAQDLFDGQLEKQLLWLDEIAVMALGENIPASGAQLPALESTNGALLYQIWSADGSRLIQRSTNAPETLLAPLRDGFHEINFAGRRWDGLVRTLQRSGHVVIIADRADLRFHLAEDVVNQAVYPIVIAIPVFGIMIWFIVSTGLRPVARIANELSQREASDLHPLAMDDVPRELQRLTRAANELLRRLEASFAREKRFAADAAHELRTPIAALSVHIDNAIASTPNGAQMFRPMRDGISRLSYLVEQILLLNRTVPDAYMAKFTHVDLYDVVKHVVERDMPQLIEHRHEIEVDGQPITIEGDAFALETLLHNLLANAIKYTPDGGRIAIRFEREAAVIRLRVLDSGPGIPVAERERAFERFYRIGGDQHGTSVIGCGLGLAIVKHIVDLHRGSITLADTDWGSGLCVVVTLPVVRAPEPKKAAGD